MLTGMRSAMTELVSTLGDLGRAIGLDLGATEERDVVDVATAVALMLERNPHGYRWLLPLGAALDDLCVLNAVTCRPCAEGAPHPRHEYDGCSCGRGGGAEHSIGCDLFGRRRLCDDALLHGG